LKRYPQLQMGDVPATFVVLQRQQANRYMDSRNKVSGFAHIPVISSKLSPTQQMVVDAITGLGLNVDTATVISTRSRPDAPRQCTSDMPKHNHTSPPSPLSAAFHCDDKKSLRRCITEAPTAGGGIEQDEEISFSDGDRGDEGDSFVLTFFVALQPAKLVVGRQGSKSFAEKIKCWGTDVRHEFAVEETELLPLDPGNVVIFSGAFPHAGYNYNEVNVREFFRVYTTDRPASNDDQHYFEQR